MRSFSYDPEKSYWSGGMEGKQRDTQHYQERNNKEGLLNRWRWCSFPGSSQNYHLFAAPPTKRWSLFASLNLGWFYDSLWLTMCDCRALTSRGFALSISTLLAPCCLVNNPRLASSRKRGNLILRKAGQTTPVEAPSCEWGHLGLPSETLQAWQQKNYPLQPNSNHQL